MSRHALKFNFEARASVEMGEYFSDRPAWTKKQKLALMARILAAGGHGSGITGQITARGEVPARVPVLVCLSTGFRGRYALAQAKPPHGPSRHRYPSGSRSP